MDIVEAYPDYIGKECRTVLAELIAEINEAGYFVDDIDGHEKNIVIQLEPGSIMPSDGSYKVSFGEEEFIEYFKEFLRPQLIEALF